MGHITARAAQPLEMMPGPRSAEEWNAAAVRQHDAPRQVVTV